MTFREVARKNRTIDKEECLRLLQSEKRGVLAVLGDGDYPYAVPLNHYYDAESGKLYFHSGRAGHKVDAILKHSKASFCVYDRGYREPEEWALHIKSVVVFGTIEIVEDYEKAMAICTALSHKFTEDDAYILEEIERSGKGTLVFALVPEHITGKLIEEA
ncbi:MAG: pyridoxamine 5'-phosphate oxidase family protein [Clostridia bacterium]|nr:pyridoxamine 5'-phosphate oxidase family protein [Clostridia bacterium]